MLGDFILTQMLGLSSERGGSALFGQALTASSDQSRVDAVSENVSENQSENQAKPYGDDSKVLPVSG
ncbi:MAG: hypothetical protein KME42_26825 [Tildeniella nuda ZEHNDER 1965/U140]|jgi:hypothetical protein|nr:hypothetical protein [Tildeniella nuda ZEHNDER 1965/U140]